MTVEEAGAILGKNYVCEKGSLIYDVSERSVFSADSFWELYDSIITLGTERPENEANLETGGKICRVCQWVLEMMIHHFDKNDLYEMKSFPQNYTDYIERLGDAADTYFRGVYIDESLYSIKRPQGK